MPGTEYVLNEYLLNKWSNVLICGINQNAEQDRAEMHSSVCLGSPPHPHMGSATVTIGFSTPKPSSFLFTSIPSPWLRSRTKSSCFKKILNHPALSVLFCLSCLSQCLLLSFFSGYPINPRVLPSTTVGPFSSLCTHPTLGSDPSIWLLGHN